jgi:cation:H+ antiporter
MAIAITSLFRGIPEISAGDTLGSNVIDVSIVLAIPVLVAGGIKLSASVLPRLLFMFVMISLMMCSVLTFDYVPQWYGALLIVIFLATMWALWERREVTMTDDDPPGKNGGSGLLLLKLAVSFAGVIGSSTLSVQCAEFIAEATGANLGIIGSTIFALGTSLPEISINVSAVRKRKYSLAVGNALGSVLSQAGLVLGVLILGSKGLDLTAFKGLVPFVVLAYGFVAWCLYEKRSLRRFDAVILALIGIGYLVHQAWMG